MWNLSIKLVKFLLNYMCIEVKHICYDIKIEYSATLAASADELKSIANNTIDDERTENYLDQLKLKMLELIWSLCELLLLDSSALGPCNYTDIE